MATFKVGQRVRIVKAGAHYLHLIGREGTIYAIPYYDCVCGVTIDGAPEGDFPAW